MTKNPCRECELAFEYKGRKMSAYKEECIKCEKLIKHKKYLESKRKFTKGEQIKSLDELFKEDWVIWNDSTRSTKVFQNMFVKTVKLFVDNGSFYKAIRREE